MRTSVPAALAAIIAALAVSNPGLAHEGHDHGAQPQLQMPSRGAGQRNDEGQSATRRAGYDRSMRVYEIPRVTLTNAELRRVQLQNLFAAESAVMLDIVPENCGAKCAQMSRIFSEVPAKLGADGRKLRMISIFADPARMASPEIRTYARESRGGGWQMLTASERDFEMVQQAFDSASGGTEAPVTLVRPARGKPWLRIEGVASADDLAREIRELMAK